MTMRCVSGALLFAFPTALLASCNFALGLGGYDFEADGGGGRSSTSTSHGGHDGGTTSAQGGFGGGTTTSASTGGGGGEGGSLPSGVVAWNVGIGMQAVTVGGAAVDSKGHVYVGGAYVGPGAPTAPLSGCDKLFGTSNASIGFLIELDTSGKCVRALALGAMVTAVATSPADDLTIALAYAAPVDLPGWGMQPAPAFTDTLVIRYPADADFGVARPPTWVRQVGAAGDQVVTDLAIDAGGNVWVSGWYTTSLAVGSGPASLTKSGVAQKTGFTFRLEGVKGDPHPDVFRLFPSTTGLDVEALAVAVSAGAQIAVGGRSVGGLDFGEGPESPKGSFEGYFARYALPAMSYAGGAWLSDTADQIVRDVQFAPKGDLYVAGTAQGTVTFATGITLPLGTQRAFLARIPSDGATPKPVSIGDTDIGGIRAAILPKSGDVVFAGMMRSNVSLPGTVPLTVNPAANDVVVGRIDATLSEGVWLRAYGDGNEQGADALALGADGAVVIAGHFAGVLAFDPLMPLTGPGLFVAKINP